MSIVGIFLHWINTWIKKINIKISLIFKIQKQTYFQYTNSSDLLLQCMCILSYGLSVDLKGLGPVDCFFFNREEASICVGIRAEEMLSSYGPSGVNISRKKNPGFHHCDASGCLCHARGIHQVMRFWESAIEITNLSEKKILSNG